MDGLHIHNDRPRPWLTTYVDPSTRLESIAGSVTVTTKPEFAAAACGVEAGKPSDVADLGAVSVACDTAGTAATSPPPPVTRAEWPTDEWRSATPESQGMSSSGLARAAKLVEHYNLGGGAINATHFKANSHADAFLVVRGGRIVAEHYWGSTNATTMHDLESTTKSISSALIAHAIQRKLLSVKTPVSKYYDIKPLTAAAGSKPLLMENVLAMSAGMNGTYWEDRTWFGHCRDWNRAFRQGTGPDGVETGRFVAEHGLLKTPGSSFVYSWCNTGLASGIFKQVTGKGLAAYASQPGGLFEKIGIRNGTFRWMGNKYGENELDGSSYHTARNVARFGYLMLNGGRWAGEQLLDADYVAAINRPTPAGVGGCANYSHFFWHKPIGGVPDDAYVAYGGGGQFVVVIPSLDLVVVSFFGGRMATFNPPADIESWPPNATEYLPKPGVDVVADTGPISGKSSPNGDGLCAGASGWNFSFVEPPPTKITPAAPGKQFPGSVSCGGSGAAPNWSHNPPADLLTTMVASVVAAVQGPPRRLKHTDDTGLSG